MEVTRRYTTDTVWHFQEFMVILNDELVAPQHAYYCDIRDTAQFFRLTYLCDENIFAKPGASADSILGVEIILDNDSIRGLNVGGALIAKEKFVGIIKFDKRRISSQNGKKHEWRTSIYLDTKNIITFGSLLEQYKAINHYCIKNGGN